MCRSSPPPGENAEVGALVHAGHLATDGRAFACPRGAAGGPRITG